MQPGYERKGTGKDMESEKQRTFIAILHNFLHAHMRKILYFANNTNYVYGGNV